MSQRPASFIVSILVHVAVVGLVIFGFVYAPRVDDRAYMEHFVLHRVDLNQPDPEERYAGGSSSLYPVAKTKESPKKSLGSPAAPPASRPLVARQKVEQTLIQPEVAPDKVLPKTIPVPAMLLWSPPAIKVKSITPPPPQIVNTADLQPTIDPPNREVNLADLAISSTPFTSRIPVTQPSTTTPAVVHGTTEDLRIPETTSVSSAQSATAAVLSISNLQMAQGTVMLPPANEVAGNSSAKGLNAGSGDPSSEGIGMGAGGHDKNGAEPAGLGAGDEKSGGKGQGKDGTVGAGKGKGAGATPGSGSGPGPDYNRTYDRISLPKTGQFGVVVVGSTMGDQYPETSQIWSGRLTYSVYLHVGMAKSWILQYSLPRSADAASAGNIARIGAPWPYYIIRPNLAPGDINSNALMIHGLVNEAGRFESLAVVFPPAFTQSQFVLDALRQWQFRPATQNGHPASVEVLLIIPGESE